MLRRKIKNIFLTFTFGAMIIAPTPFFWTDKNISIENHQILNNDLDAKTNYKNINSFSNESDNSKDLEGINGFSEYYPFYNDVFTPSVTTNLGVIGKTKNSDKIILTSYNGLVLWGNNLREDNVVKNFYNTVLKINDISSYTIKSWIEMGDYLPVLFSDNSNNNGIVVVLDINTGKVFSPGIDANGAINSQKNIVNVPDGTRALYKSSLQNSFYSMADGSSSQMENKSLLITISDKGISGFNLRMNKDIAENSSDDKFIGFAPGSRNDPNNKQYMMFMNDSSKLIYVVIVDSNLKRLVKYDLPNSAKFENSTQGIMNNINNIPRHQYTVSYKNNKTNVLFITYGAKSSIFAVSFQNDPNGSHSLVKEIKLYEENIEVANSSLSEISEEIIVSVDKTISTTIFGKINFEKFDDSLEFSKIKTSTHSSQRNKAWNFTMVKNANNSAYIYYDPSITNMTLYREHKVGGIFQNAIRVEFNRYLDPKTQLEEFKNTHIPSSITPSNLLEKLTFVREDSLITKSIQDFKADDKNGALSFSYVISMKNWWNNDSSKFLYKFSLSGFYLTSKINFYFITSSSDNKEKFKEIINLKKTKYANQVTKDEVKNHFIHSNIVDKNGDTFEINNDMITLTPSEDNYSLTIKIQIPNSKFPQGVSEIPGLLVKEQTYTGFVSTLGYDFEVSNMLPKKYESIYPSQVTFNNVINDIVNLGPSYSILETDWEFKMIADDLKGTLTIEKMIYKASNLSSEFPDNKKNIITSNKVYRTLKSTVGSFVSSPSISNLTINDTKNKLPSEIWKEYQDAKNISTSDSLALEKTIIYRNLSNNVTVNKADLELTLMNENTADQDGLLEIGITIKDGVELQLRDGKNKNVKFDSTFKNELIKSKPSFYPFKSVVSVAKQDFSLDWAPYHKENDALHYSEDKQNVTVDLDVGTWTPNIKSSITANEFYNQFSFFIPDILDLFRFSNGYQEVIENPVIDNVAGTAWIKVDFIPIIGEKENNSIEYKQGFDIVSKQVIIKGFKIPPSPVISTIPIVLGTIFLASIIVLSIYAYVRLKSFKFLKDQKFSNYENEGKRILVEDFRKKQNKKQISALEKAIENSKNIENKKKSIFSFGKTKENENKQALDFMSSKSSKNNKKTLGSRRPTLDDFKTTT